MFLEISAVEKNGRHDFGFDFTLVAYTKAKRGGLLKRDIKDDIRHTILTSMIDPNCRKQVPHDLVTDSTSDWTCYALIGFMTDTKP